MENETTTTSEKSFTRSIATSMLSATAGLFAAALVERGIDTLMSRRNKTTVNQ